MVLPVMRRAGIYVRISKDRKGDLLGVTRQEDECRALAAEKGWEVVTTYIDDDMSAFKGKRRPGYDRLLADIRTRDIDSVLALHPDRFNKGGRALEDFIEVVESTGCLVKTVHFDHYDVSTRSGRMIARVIGAVARDESEAKAERLVDKHEELARKGRWKGGPRPYGYDLAKDAAGTPRGDGRLVIVQKEADVITDAAERVLAGETLYSICTELNARPEPTAQGAVWRTQTLRRILTDWTHAGMREHRGEPVCEAVWPPIIDETTHRRLRLVLLDPSRAVGRRARVFLLTGGLAYCGLCEAKLVGMRRGGSSVRAYACQRANDKVGCGGICCIAEPFEALVVEAVMIRLDTPELARVVASGKSDTGPRKDDAEADLAASQAKLEELADLWAQGEITRSEWLRARKGVQDRRDQAQRRLRSSLTSNAAARWVAKSGVLRSVWPQMNLDQRRAVIGAVIERVVVHPTKIRGRFDPERIDVIWRG